MNKDSRNRISNAITELNPLRSRLEVHQTALRELFEGADETVITAAQVKVDQIKTSLAEIRGKVDDLKSDVETIRDEEQDAYDNLPEGLQQSERGENSQSAIDSLDNAIYALDSVVDSIESVDIALTDADPETAKDSIDEAVNQGEEADTALNEVE